MTKTKLNALCAHLDMLAARWKDEKEFEDFADYEAAALKACEQAGVEFVSLEKSPFRLTIEEQGARTEFKVTSKQVEIRTESPALTSGRKIVKEAAAKEAPKPAVKPAPSKKDAPKAAAKPAKKAPKPVPAKKAPKPVPAKKEATKAVGIGARTIELLKRGLSAKATFEQLQQELGAVSSMASVYWYSSKIRCGEF